MLCEVCGKPVDPLDDFIDSYKDRFDPSEYLDKVNNLNDDEKEQRRQLFRGLFRKHGFEGEVA